MASGNTTKLLESGEEAFHQVAVFIYMSIIVSLFSSVPAGRNHCYRASSIDQRDKRIGVVALITYDHFCTEAFDQGRGLRNIAYLTACQYPAQRIAERVHGGMNLGAQPATRTPERLTTFFFWAPAACWCARTTVLSTNNASKSLSLLTASITRCHTPALPQREKRVYVLIVYRP